MESHPQNPEFRNNPENFHLCIPASNFLVNGLPFIFLAKNIILMKILNSGIILKTFTYAYLLQTFW